MNADAITEILIAAHRNNHPRGVTGVLLYQNQFFVQVLEGKPDDVQYIFDKIKNDPRHSNVTVIQQNPIKKRGFPTWSMGFKNLDELSGEDAEKLRDFLEAPITEEDFTEQRPIHLTALVDRVMALYAAEN